MRTGLGLGVTYDVDAEFFSSYSLSFDGSNDYVNGVGNCPTSAFTISVWAKKVGEDGWYAMYSATTQIWFGIGDNEQVRLHVGGTPYIDTASSVITVGAWHHIVATYDGSTTGKIYIDGVDQSLTPSGTLELPDATASNIGRHPSGLNYFSGNLDEVALWDAALSEKDIKRIYNNGMPNNLLLPGVYATDRTSNLKGWWRFEEGSGTSVADSSGNGNTGTISGASSGGGKQLPI